MKKTKLLSIVALLAVLLSFLAFSQTANAVTEEKTLILDECDSADNWANIFVDTTNYITGKGSLYNRSVVANLNAVFRNLDTSKLPAFQNAYLEMYVYFSDVGNISMGGGHGQIELNSSGSNDIQEIYHDFNPAKIALKDGWNFISLKLTDFSPTDGKFVYSSLKGMRIYAISKNGNPNIIRLDNVVITDTPKYASILQNGFTAKSTPYYRIDMVVDETVYEEIATFQLQN